MPIEKVEVGFNLIGTNAPNLTLDDPIKGQLDSTWTLGGTTFVDITNDVQEFTINRGKSRQLDGYSAGEAIVTLKNTTRNYDPTYASSPYYGNIIPKKEIRISSNGDVQFQGLVDDWNLDYAPGRLDTATLVASDAFVYLNNQTLSASTATAQLAGNRVSSILDQAGFSAGLRSIDSGSTTLGADVIPEDQNVLAYLKVVETTESGRLFITKTGQVRFIGRNGLTTNGLVSLTDNGTGIPYQNLKVVYGSEELANEVVISNKAGSTAIATDPTSQGLYGVFNYTSTDLLMQSTSDVVNLATYLASKYGEPEYRFESMDVRLNELTANQQDEILGLELGDVVSVTFTPSGIPPAIVKYAEIIRANHSVDAYGSHIVSLGFATLDTSFMKLDDAVFGRLDENTLGW